MNAKRDLLGLVGELIEPLAEQREAQAPLGEMYGWNWVMHATAGLSMARLVLTLLFYWEAPVGRRFLAIALPNNNPSRLIRVLFSVSPFLFIDRVQGPSPYSMHGSHNYEIPELGDIDQ